MSTLDKNIRGTLDEAGNAEYESLSTDKVSIRNQLVSVEMSSTQTISDATVTKIQFDAVNVDKLNAWDTTNYNFTAPTDGKYLISSYVRWQGDTGWSTGDTASAGRVNVNGSLWFVPTFIKTGTGLETSGIYGQVLKLASGDVVDVRAYQTSGAGKVIEGPTVRSNLVIGRIG